MILLFVGLPGSGKTYEAITKIVSNLANGREVYTNIDGLDKADCRHVIKELCDLDDYTFENSLHFLTPDQVPFFWEHITDNSLVLIDECHKYWNSRAWQKEENNALSTWAAEHRHHGNDVVFLTQKPERLDSQVRSLAAWTHEFRKLNMFGRFFRNGYQVFIYEGEPSGKPLSTQFRNYNPKFFRAYQSHTSADIKEMGVTKLPNVLNHWSLYACGLVLVVFLFLFSQSSFSKGKVFDYEVSAKAPQRSTLKKIDSPPQPDPPVVPDHVPDRLPSPAAQPVSDLSESVWLLVSAYLETSDGRQFVNVGNFRLSSWLKLSDDKKLVLVNRSEVPGPILDQGLISMRYSN